MIFNNKSNREEIKGKLVQIEGLKEVRHSTQNLVDRGQDEKKDFF
jgi:hypothetical protein